MIFCPCTNSLGSFRSLGLDSSRKNRRGQERMVDVAGCVALCVACRLRPSFRGITRGHIGLGVLFETARGGQLGTLNCADANAAQSAVFLIRGGT
jgi:hypothetical protein